MQITLNQDEIHDAVDAYVRSQINIADNQAISIDFTAGRGANGLSATLDIRQASTTPNKPKAPTRTAAPAPTPAPEKADVSSTEEKPEGPEDDPAAAIPDEEPEAASTQDEEPAPAPTPKKAGALFNKKAAAPADDEPAGEQTEEEPTERPRPKSVFSKAG